MAELLYTVTATFPSEDVASRWLAWLDDPHLEDMLAAGARDAEVVRLDGEPIRYEARYRFASREAFDTYQRDHGPRLRADGLGRFPPELGIVYQRTVGVLVERRG